MTSRHSIVEVCNYWGPYPGTFIPTLVAVGRAVDERLGLDYHCVFPEPMQGRPWVELLTSAGISCSFLRDDLSPLAVTRELARLTVALDPVVVRSHFSRWDLQAAAAARRRGAAAVWHVHTGRVAGASVPATRAKDFLKVRLLGRIVCDRVFAVSEEIARLVRARGFRAGKVDVVLNGIDVARFAMLPDGAAAREQLGLDPVRPVALGFAWSPRTKGADLLIEAARPLGEAGRLQVVLVGPRTLAAEVRSPSDWLRVVDPVDDVARLFAAADFFVSASRDEGFSYAIGEAMASRLPVISSDVPGPSGYFSSPGVSTFRSEDVSSLRARLEAVLVDPGRPEAGEANREFVREHFSIESHVDRVISLFSELRRG